MSPKIMWRNFAQFFLVRCALVSCSMAVLGILGWAGAARAQVSPIGVTGFNENMVLAATASWPGSLTATMDNGTLNVATATGKNTWYQVGDASSGAPATGLPMGTTFTSSSSDATTGVAAQFTLQGVNTNNAVLLASANAPTSATLTLNTPTLAPTLSFLAADGNAANIINVTVNFLGGGSYTSSINPGDWFNNGTNTAYVANGRVAYNGSGLTFNNVNSGDPRLYFYDVTGVPDKYISSISLSYSSGSGNTAIFAVSGSAASTNNWVGGTNGNWSLASSDANWSNSSHTYSDGSNVVFNNSGNATSVNVAATVQPGTVTFSNSSLPYSFSGAAISGTGSVYLGPAAGTVTFNSSNSYSGATAISAGKLQIGNSSALGTGTVLLQGGELSSNGATAYSVSNPLILAANAALGDTVNNGALTFTSASGTLSNSPTLTINSPVTINAGLGGTSGLTVAGTGSLTLTSSNTSYNGATNISSGTLALQDTTGFASAVNVGNSGTLVLTRSTTGFANRKPIAGSAVTGSGVINVNNAAGGINGGWATINASTLNFSGIINVNSGVLATDSAGVVAGTATLNVASGGVAALHNATSGWTIGPLNGAGDVAVAQGTAGPTYTLTLGNGNGSGTFSGIIHGNNSNTADGGIEAGFLALTKTGTGNEVLTGVNTYSGSTAVNGGTLSINGGGSIAASAVTVNANGTR